MSCWNDELDGKYLLRSYLETGQEDGTEGAWMEWLIESVLNELIADLISKLKLTLHSFATNQYNSDSKVILRNLEIRSKDLEIQ